MSDLVIPGIDCIESTEKFGRFVAEPLEKGVGITLGNALRRVLLAALPGAAVTSIRIADVPHEFTAIPGVREDVVRFILQVKQLRLQMDSQEPMRMSLQVRGEGTVTAGDIHAPPEIEVLNPDLYLLTVDAADTNLDIEFVVEQGRGYLSFDGRGRMPVGELPIDAIFSPIRRVAFNIDRARVGQMTDYDRLTLEIWTDGRMAPLEALKEAARIRLRPIIMTTLTTVLGLLPMALGLGEGAEIRSPMALTVIGGLLGATVLTLLVIPCVYSLVDRGK